MLPANGNPTRSIPAQAGSTIQNSNVLALSAATAGSQSHLVSALRSSVRNAVKSEDSSNEKEGTGQPCSSAVPDSMSSPPNKRLKSDSSLNSVDSANDTMHVRKTDEVSGVKCADNSFSIGAINFESEAHSKPVSSRDEEMVDHSGTQMEQSESRTQATTFELQKVKYAGTTTNTGTSTTDGGTNSATEEKHQIQATSEPHIISDVEMTIPTGSGKPICQSSNVSIEEKPNTDAACEPPIDQSNNLASEEKSSEQTSVQNDGGIPSSQSEHANGLNGDGLIESPCGDKNKSGCNAASDHGTIQTVVQNGVLHPKEEMLCVTENEAVALSTEAKVAK